MSTLHSHAPEHVVVIGGGLAGLAAAYDLARQGCQVTLLEASAAFGGLASSIMLDGQAVERYYHFICRGDSDLIDLIGEMGLSEQLHWAKTRTAFYSNRRLYNFGTPFDLMAFDCIPLVQRIRFGMNILWSCYQTHWQELDRVPAKDWLIQNIGDQAYNAIWHPLLKVKFGVYHDQISAAWIWHRIWRVAKSRQSLLSPEMFGYLENGSSSLCDRLVTELRSAPGSEVRSGARVEQIEIEDGRVSGVVTQAGRITCDRVVSTVPTSILTSLLPAFEDPYFRKMKEIQSIGVVCMLLTLKTEFSPYYWTNINDKRISYNGIIELTNLNTHLRERGMHLLYIPYYLATDEPRYGYSDQALYDEYIQSLKVVNPAFDETEVKEWRVARDANAQAICKTNFSTLIPDIRSPIGGLYVTDSCQFYPEDRTLSAAVRLGRKAARLAMENPD